MATKDQAVESKATDVAPSHVQEAHVFHKDSLIMIGGEAISDLPEDLYIPPQALQVVLESFQGPLDLLLYLIRKQNLDILDIPVAKITNQYVEYVHWMRHLNLELAAEYLVMAAILGEIKSRCLLPTPPNDDEDSEQDPRAELIRRLQAYEQIQKAAQDLDQLPRWDRDIFPTKVAIPSIEIEILLPDLSLDDLVRAFSQVLQRASLFEHHAIKREYLSTRERMSSVLAQVNNKGFLPFVSLFTLEEGRAGVVVTFLAVLELVKEALVEVIQADIMGVIYVRSKQAALIEVVAEQSSESED